VGVKVGTGVISVTVSSGAKTSVGTFVAIGCGPTSRINDGNTHATETRKRKLIQRFMALL
jgi:hypothetical protein